MHTAGAEGMGVDLRATGCLELARSWLRGALTSCTRDRGRPAWLDAAGADGLGVDMRAAGLLEVVEPDWLFSLKPMILKNEASMNHTDASTQMLSAVEEKKRPSACVTYVRHREGFPDK